ncbi:MAG: hypothetical protein ACXACI_15905 [Candidatus Hodarchaeales archaeon]
MTAEESESRKHMINKKPIRTFGLLLCLLSIIGDHFSERTRLTIGLNNLNADVYSPFVYRLPYGGIL